ncbi:MAG: transposase [Desulfotomaculales bacterium]
MYVLQQVLFPFEVFVKNCDQDDQIFLALASINTEPVKKMFPPHKGVDRHGYSRAALFRALVLQRLLQLPGIEALVRCLKYSPQLAHWCGFDIRKSLPSATVFYRFLAELKEQAGQELLEQAVKSLVARTAKLAKSEGKIVLDSTDIPAREKAPRKKDDPGSFGSAWGHRTAADEETEMFYGYKLHAATLLTNIGPIPLAAILAPANVSDRELAPRQEHERLFGFCPEYYLMDAGYDSGDIYQLALDLKGQAIIKLNRRNQKGPPQGFNEELIPLCPAGQPMVYWGADKKHMTIKFRCPKAAGRQVKCESQCRCNNPYGLVVRFRVTDNPRLFSCPHRGSENWQRLYSQRTAIERWFALLKEHLDMDKMNRRGIDNAFTDVMLCLITFLAGTLAQLKIEQQIRKAA